MVKTLTIQMNQFYKLTFQLNEQMDILKYSEDLNLSFNHNLPNVYQLIYSCKYQMNMQNSQPNESNSHLKLSVWSSKEGFSSTKIDDIQNSKFIDKTKFPDQFEERIRTNFKKNQPGTSGTIWTEQQIRILFSSYKERGSKWTQISKKIPGRNQNNVKNKFYGSLRKMIRCFNRKLKGIGKKKRKQIQMKSVIKIFQLAEGYFRIQHSFLEKSQDLRNTLLNQAEKGDMELGYDQIKQIADKINQLSIAIRSYKTQRRSLSHIKPTEEHFGSSYSPSKCEFKQLKEEFIAEIEKQHLQNNGRIEKQNEKQFSPKFCQFPTKYNCIIDPVENEQPRDLMDYQSIFQNDIFQKWDRMLLMQYNLSDPESE